MGFLDRLFGGKKKQEEESLLEEAADAAECPHTALVPRWDDAQDMGKQDKISGYSCEGCGEIFSPEEGEKLKAAEDQRIRALEVDR